MRPIENSVYRLARQLNVPQPDMSSVPREAWAALGEAAEDNLRLKFLSFPLQNGRQYVNLVIGRRGNEWRERDQFVFGWYAGQEGAYYRSISEEQLPDTLRSVVASIEKNRKRELRSDIALKWMQMWMLFLLLAGVILFVRGYQLQLSDRALVLLLLGIMTGVGSTSWLASVLSCSILWKKDPIFPAVNSIRTSY